MKLLKALKSKAVVIAVVLVFVAVLFAAHVSIDGFQTRGVPLQHVNLVQNPNPPDWGQQVVRASLVASAVKVGSTYTIAGPGVEPISITVTDKGNFAGNQTYSLGDLVTLPPVSAGKKPQAYLNMGWNKDTRGCPAYCGTYNQSPANDKYAWKAVNVLA